MGCASEVPGFESQLHFRKQSQLPDSAHPGRQKVMLIQAVLCSQLQLGLVWAFLCLLINEPMDKNFPCLLITLKKYIYIKNSTLIRHINMDSHPTGQITKAQKVLNKCQNYDFQLNSDLWKSSPVLYIQCLAVLIYMYGVFKKLVEKVTQIWKHFFNKKNLSLSSITHGPSEGPLTRSIHYSLPPLPASEGELDGL